MTHRNLTQKLMQDGESVRVAIVHTPHDTEAIGRHVVALLNTQGGSVLIEGSVNAEQDADAIRKFLRHKISPQVIYTVSIDPTEKGDVLVVDVPQGEDKPYVFMGAIYIRVAKNSIPADANTMRQMVEDRASQPQRWERRASSGLEMGDFDDALIRKVVQRAQEKRGYQFESPDDLPSVLNKLALTRFGQFTNAADVLFAKQVFLRHPQTRVRAVCYETDKGNRFIDEQLFEGPVLTILGKVMDFFRRHVSISSEFTSGSLTRTSRPQYPWHALREGMVNAFAHRDYASFAGSVAVSIYPDRIEIRNSGRLPKGISAQSLLRETHDSILVNPDISHVFYLYELMERVGRGTFKIVQECRDNGMRLPEWKSIAGTVRLTFYSADQYQTQPAKLNERQRELLGKLQYGDTVNRLEYIELYKGAISDRTARRDLTELENNGYLERHGAGPTIFYERTKRDI